MGLKIPKSGTKVPILRLIRCDLTMPGTSIGDALFTKTQQRLLSLIYGHPDQSLYLNELVRLAQVGRGAVARELTKLTDSGLVIMTRQGNQNHYQANPESPIFKGLTHPVTRRFGLPKRIKAVLPQKLHTPRQAVT